MRRSRLNYMKNLATAFPRVNYSKLAYPNASPLSADHRLCEREHARALVLSLAVRAGVGIAAGLGNFARRRAGHAAAARSEAVRRGVDPIAASVGVGLRCDAVADGGKPTRSATAVRTAPANAAGCRHCEHAKRRTGTPDVERSAAALRRARCNVCTVVANAVARQWLDRAAGGAGN